MMRKKAEATVWLIVGIVALFAIIGLCLILKTGATVTGKGYDLALTQNPPLKWDRNMYEQSLAEHAEGSTKAWQTNVGRYRPTGFQPYTSDVPGFPTTMDTSGRAYPRP
jgi:hypothetical protein